MCVESSITLDERCKILLQLGYKVDSVRSYDINWDEEDGEEYKVHSTCFIAYKEDNPPSTELLNGTKTFLEREFGVDVVFSRELKERLIRKLFG